MADCECLAGCIFFNDQMKDMPSMADHIKSRYCRDDNRSCARYVVFKALGKENVPADLFPVSLDLAQKLIDDHK